MTDWIKIEDCCEILDSQRIPIKSSERKAGPYPYYGANGIQDHVDDFIFDDELVLLAEDGGNFNSKDKPIAYRVSGKCWVNNHAHVLKPKNNIDVDYLCYSLMYYKVDGIINGATRQKLTQSSMRKMKIPKRDLKEQHRITQKLKTIQDIKEKYQQEKNKLEYLVKARFVEMFGDVVINSKKWSVYKMSDITESRLGKMLDKKQQTGKNLFPYLANFNVQWFQFDLKELNEMDFDEADQKEFKLEEGDILVCEGGEIGRCAVWHNQIKNCFFQKALHRIRCNKEYILPDYLSWWFKLSCENHAFDSVAGAKATIAHLPGVKLKKLDVVVPPLDLQKKFVSILSQIDKSKFLYLRKDML